MALVIKLVGGIPGIERYPELVEQIGRYVMRYEPENEPKGKQWIWTTDDPNEALKFEDMADLHEFYKQSIGIRPRDGQPDRPLTAFHIEVTHFPSLVREVKSARD